MMNYDTTNYNDMKPFLAPTDDNLNPRQKAYREYLKTPEWQKRRRERLKIDNYTCQWCGCQDKTGRTLNVHHLDYKSHTEDGQVYGSLVTLCRRCHVGVHNMMNRITSPDGARGWKDSLDVSMVSFITEGDDDEEQRN